ncbi:MAG TPA: mechanosensitive ion channel domain-containing protein [Pyrinomonadaceae bacterium]|nr:mechanosensitive ion channel domain-containing protein [Pyrinomonadaceae bacterium]
MKRERDISIPHRLPEKFSLLLLGPIQQRGGRPLILNFFILILFWQEREGVHWQAWSYLNRVFTFGRISVSVATLVQGIAVLVLALALSRWVSSLLERRIVKRAQIDPGIGYTIGRLSKYLITTIGVLLFLQVAFSVDLTSLAVVFTALSVGIGFGLQYIAADIASGFILLFERPVRVGDRITIGNDEGDVRSINLRTTTVITNDRIAIIVPNSKLVSQRVINWSYGDPRARIPIPISVAIDSDIDLVTETLLLAAEGIDRVLTDPPPKVQFLSFGGYSLEFRLLVWTRHPSRHPQIRSDINYRIEKLFRERGIEIPYPTQEFLLKTPEAVRAGDDLIALEKSSVRDTEEPGDDRNSPRRG